MWSTLMRSLPLYGCSRGVFDAIPETGWDCSGYSLEKSDCSGYSLEKSLGDPPPPPVSEISTVSEARSAVQSLLCDVCMEL